MEQENKIPLKSQEIAGEIKKNKGGRPKGKPDSATCKVTLYLTEEEHALLTEFAKTAWWSLNYSGAGRHLVLMGLKEWVRREKGSLIKLRTRYSIYIIGVPIFSQPSEQPRESIH